MRVLVTRPQAQADEWVARLAALGVDACALSLIAIGPAPDAGALRDAWRQLAALQLAMFVSANAVEQFFAARPDDAAWPAATWAGCTGPGTAAALRAAGVPAERIVAPPLDALQFDSEALWPVLAALRPWGGARVLIVRGNGGRDWLGDKLRGVGAQVRAVEAYWRSAPRLDASQRGLLAEALRTPEEHLWLFSSSEAAGHLPAVTGGADFSASQALATHERIADAVRAIGFGSVARVAPSPEAVAVAAQGR